MKHYLPLALLLLAAPVALAQTQAPGPQTGNYPGVLSACRSLLSEANDRLETQATVSSDREQAVADTAKKLDEANKKLDEVSKKVTDLTNQVASLKELNKNLSEANAKAAPTPEKPK